MCGYARFDGSLFDFAGKEAVNMHVLLSISMVLFLWSLVRSEDDQVIIHCSYFK
jgi:hypothetical protein